MRDMAGIGILGYGAGAALRDAGRELELDVIGYGAGASACEKSGTAASADGLAGAARGTPPPESVGSSPFGERATEKRAGARVRLCGAGLGFDRRRRW